MNYEPRTMNYIIELRNNTPQGGSGKFSVFRKMPVKGCKGTVLQTNTGGRVEYTKVIERTILKELCNTTGRKLARCPPHTARLWGAVNTAERLFIKNTGPC